MKYKITGILLMSAMICVSYRIIDKLIDVPVPKTEMTMWLEQHPGKAPIDWGIYKDSLRKEKIKAEEVSMMWQVEIDGHLYIRTSAMEVHGMFSGGHGYGYTHSPSCPCGWNIQK